jgi:chromate reductase
MRILGISGSFRTGSLNTMLLKNAQDLAPAGVTVEICDYSAVPLYNDDVFVQGFPPAVQAFREAIRSADALLFCTPEYNRSVPGPLKNAIDWASRPKDMPLAGKPVAITGATPGALGAAAAIFHLRHILCALGVSPVCGKDLFIPSAKSKFDDSGRLTDEGTREHLKDLVARLVRLAEQLRR